MKKYSAILFALCLMFTATSCAAVDEGSKKEIVSVESGNSSSTDENDSSKEDSEKDNDEESEEESKKESNEKSDEVEQSVNIEEQVLWEVDDLKITATGLSEDGFFGTQLNILVENNSDKDVGISTDAVIVNDYMINDLTYIHVTAGNKSNDSITLFSSELEAAGIDNIGKIELYLHTYDPETYMTNQESGCITITTSNDDSIDTENNIDGVTLFDQDGIKIVGQYVDEDSFWGAAVLLYIENNTENNIIVSADDVAVNGFMITSLSYTTVYAEKKCISDITLFQSDLENNNITSIDNIETSFKIMDENYHEITNSGKVNFSTK